MPTISDVARAAGVSSSTVSRVLNQPDLVVADKRDRVLAIIHHLDYRPSTVARNLRRGSFDTLALLVGDISQPFHGGLAKAVEAAAEELGYGVLLCDLDHRQERLIGFLRHLPHGGIDGLILASADNLDLAPIRSAIASARELGVAVVITGQPMRTLDVPAVVVDLAAAAHDATMHLAEQGVWPIAFLGGGRRSSVSLALQRGYEAACRELGRRADPRWIVNGRFQFEPARSTISRLLNGQEVRGVVAANAPMAIGGFRAAFEKRLVVPSDLAIVCCENVSMASYLTPTLTTVGANFDELGRRAVEALIQAARGMPALPIKYVDHHLVVRDSSAMGPVTSASSPRIHEPQENT